MSALALAPPELVEYPGSNILAAGCFIHNVQSGAKFYTLGRQHGKDTIY